MFIHAPQSEVMQLPTRTLMARYSANVFILYRLLHQFLIKVKEVKYMKPSRSFYHYLCLTQVN